MAKKKVKDVFPIQEIENFFRGFGYSMGSVVELPMSKGYGNKLTIRLEKASKSKSSHIFICFS